jgi:hypothetical protein
MLGGLPFWHWLIVVAVVLVLFGGRGSIESLMTDFARGIGENADSDEFLRAVGKNFDKWLMIVAVCLALAYAILLVAAYLA